MSVKGALLMSDDPENRKLAREIIDVHGDGAADVARDNARTAALAGHAPQAKVWLKIVALIQRQQVKA